jgi:hypothetical protein
MKDWVTETAMANGILPDVLMCDVDEATISIAALACDTTRQANR